MSEPATTSKGANDSRSFLAMYRATVGEVYSYLASRVTDRAAAEDLTQEVFIAGARRHAAGEAVDIAWLIGVARHKLIDHWRARGREQRKLALAHSMAAEDDHSPLTDIDVGVATTALAALNPTYRAALVLRHVDGLPVPQVAEHLGRSVAAAEQILTRARVAFRLAYREACS